MQQLPVCNVIRWLQLPRCGIKLQAVTVGGCTPATPPYNRAVVLMADVTVTVTSHVAHGPQWALTPHLAKVGTACANFWWHDATIALVAFLSDGYSLCVTHCHH